MSLEEYLNNIENMSIEDFYRCGLGVREYFWDEYKKYLKKHNLQEV